MGWQILLSLCLYSCIICIKTQDDARMKPRPTYLIAAPLQVRPEQTVQIMVVIYELRYPLLDVHASIRREGEEVAKVTERFLRPTYRLLQLEMPDYATAGNYTLLVEGLTTGGFSAPVFRNETKITFSSKHVSVFIKTDKIVYDRFSPVHFRVFAVKPNLLPMTGSINIYVKDARGEIVRRWLGRQVNHGVYTGSFETTDPARFGWWTIEVEGWGQRYQTRFKLVHFFIQRFEVIASMQNYIFDNEFGIAGTVGVSNSLNDMIAYGNATVDMEVIPPGKTRVGRVDLTQAIPVINGQASFMFRMDEIQKYTGKLAGTKLSVKATLFDWRDMEEAYDTANCTIYSNDIQIRFLGGRIRTFKPGVPLTAYIGVYRSDGSKFIGDNNPIVYVGATARSRKGVTRTMDEETFLIPDDSIVKFTFMSEMDDEMVSVRAAYGGNKRVYSEMRAYRHFTRSDHYLQVTTSTEKPRINTYMIFTVRTSAFVPTIHYKIVANGNIYIADAITMKFRQKTFALAVSRDMMPSAKIIVFCVLNNGEVLADSLSFFIDGIRANKVEVRVNTGKDFSKDTLEITGITESSTFTAFSSIFEDYYNAGAHCFITPHEVEEELLSYSDQGNSSFKHTWNLENYKQQNEHFPAPSYAIDANTTFTFSGLIVFTDADLTRIPAWLICNETLGYFPCFDGSCFTADQQCDGVWQCEDGADEMGCPGSEEPIPSPPDGLDDLTVTLSHLQEPNWAWKTLYTMPNGRTDYKVEPPIDPNTWTTSAVSLNKDTGMGITEDPPTIDVARWYYFEIGAPEKAVRGEQIGLQVAMFNNWDQSLEILLTLVGSSQYKFVLVDDGGVTSSYNPRTVGGDVQTMVYMRAGEMQYIYIPVLPIAFGDVDIEVVGSTFIRRQSETVTINIVMDGVTNIYHTPYLIDLINKGSVMIPDLNIIVPERFIMPETREHLYVPGSQEATVSIVGDVVGPGFYTSILDAYKIMGYIYSSGAHSVFNFGINMYWLKFLKTTHQLPQDTLNEVLTNLNKELDSIYAYLTEDDAMAMRREMSPSDIWVTSMALEVLSAGVETAWELSLFVDVEILNKMAQWLITQQLSTGAFNQTTHVYDLKFNPVLKSKDGTPLYIAITAQGIIGLAKSKEVLSGGVKADAGTAIINAADYLAIYLDQLEDPFEICITTYALHLANHRQRSYAFEIMNKIRREDNFVYWSHEKVPPARSERVGIIPVQFPLETPLPRASAAIQATAYALLVHLRANRYVEAQPIMQWLQTQRHYDAGFVSIFDTLVATEALTAYAERNTNRGFQNMLITLQSTATHGWQKTVHLQQNNFSAYETHSIPNVFGTIRSTARGTGMALIQLTTKVNVEYERQLRTPQVKAFDLDVRSLRFHGRNSSKFDMEICIKWVATQIAPRSGSVVLEVDIPTGFEVYKGVLYENKRKGRIHSQRSSFLKQKVIMHIDHIDEDGGCWSFPGERWYPVANATIQHRVKVQDISEPGLFNTTIYTTFGLFNNHICQVCASFQCPYCPYYNTATSKHTQSTRLVGLLILISIVLHAVIQ